MRLTDINRHLDLIIPVFSIWKSLWVLQKAQIKNVARAICTYLFFLIHTLLFCFKIKSYCAGLHKMYAQLRPWTKCACKWHCSYTKIHPQYWFLYVKIIWIYQFAFFFFCIISCEGHKLWKLSTLHWCHQSVTIENCFSSNHTDYYDLR